MDVCIFNLITKLALMLFAGALITYYYLGVRDLLKLIAISTGLSLVIIPFTVFSGALISRSLINGSLLLASMSLLSIAAITLSYFKDKEGIPKRIRFDPRKDTPIILIISFICVVTFINFDHTLFEKDWDGCTEKYVYNTIEKSELLFHIYPINEIDTDTDYDYLRDDPWKLHLNKGSIPRNNEGKQYNDEPVTAGIPYAIAVVAFDGMGLRLIYTIIRGCSALLLYLTLVSITRRRMFGIFGILIYSFNQIVFYERQINITVYAACILTLLIVLIIRDKNLSLTGFIFGYLIAIKPIGIIFVPLLFWFRNISTRNLVRYASGMIVALLPIVYWKAYMDRGILRFPGFIGYKDITHSIAGIEFDIPFLMNLPFTEYATRTVGFPFPAYLLVNLHIVKVFGLILLMLIPLGLVWLFRNERRTLLVITAAFLPYYLLLIFNGNWEHTKVYLVVLLLIPMIILISYGLKEITMKRHRLIKGAIIILMGGLLYLWIGTAGNMDHAMDTRTVTINQYFSDNGSIIFEKDIENEGEVREYKQYLTSPNLLPSVYFDRPFIDIRPENIDRIRFECKNEGIREISGYFNEFSPCLSKGDEIFVIGNGLYEKRGYFYYIPKQRIGINTTIEDNDVIEVDQYKATTVDAASPGGCIYSSYTFYLKGDTIHINISKSVKDTDNRLAPLIRLRTNNTLERYIIDDRGDIISGMIVDIHDYINETGLPIRIER